MPSADSEKGVANQTQAQTPALEAEKVTTKDEESSSSWTSDFFENGKPMDWMSNPGSILLLTSVPFFAGAYFGYRMPTEQLEDLIGSVGSTEKASDIAKTTSGKEIGAKAIDQNEVRIVAARTASKALRIATLGTVGTFGFVGAVGFYMSGYKSLEEAVTGTTRWGTSLGKSLEHAMGGDQAVSKTHPDVLATKHMKSEDELKYVYDKYIKEAIDDEDNLWGDGDGTKAEKDKSPTLYSVYEKYFKTKKDD